MLPTKKLLKTGLFDAVKFNIKRTEKCLKKGKKGKIK